MAWWNWPLPDKWFEDTPQSIEKVSTMSTEQQRLMKGLGEYLQSAVGSGATPYPGALVAPMSDTEKAGMGILNKYVSGGLTPTAQLGLGQYNEALRGLSPKEVAANYMKYTAPAEQRYLKEVSIPTFKESMVPGGTLRSTGTERGIGDIISKYGEGQLGRIGERINQEERNRLVALGMLPTMQGIEGGVPQMGAAFQYGQLPRMIEQAELTAKLQEFMRTSPEMSPLIDKMLGYLGISTMAAFNQPYVPSPFLQLLSSAAPAAGEGMGIALAGGV